MLDEHRDDFGFCIGSGGCHVWILDTTFCVIECVYICTVMSVLILVALHVQGQVVGAREAAAAGDALEGFGPGVLPVVSGELIRSGETPVAVLPCTTVRLLTCRTEESVLYRTFSSNYNFRLFLITFMRGPVQH